MDFLVFYSQYSPSSQKLFEDFPNLKEKSICVDSSAMRVYVKKIHIVCVPTLIVLLGNRIIDRVVGYDSIHNWLVTSIYRMSQLQTENNPGNFGNPGYPGYPEPIHLDSSQLDTPMEDVPTAVPPEDMPTTSVSQITQLDDLILEDIPLNEQERETPLVQTGMSANTMMLAEALKKERDGLDPSANKKKFSQ